MIARHRWHIHLKMNSFMIHVNPFHTNRSRILSICVVLQYLCASFLSLADIPISFSVYCAAVHLSHQALTYNPYDGRETLGRRLVRHGICDLLDRWSQSDIRGHCWALCALIVHPQHLQHHGPEVPIHITRISFAVHLPIRIDKLSVSKLCLFPHFNYQPTNALT